MFVSCLLCCVGSDLFDGLIIRSGEPYSSCVCVYAQYGLQRHREKYKSTKLRRGSSSKINSLLFYITCRLHASACCFFFFFFAYKKFIFGISAFIPIVQTSTVRKTTLSVRTCTQVFRPFLEIKIKTTLHSMSVQSRPHLFYTKYLL